MGSRARHRGQTSSSSSCSTACGATFSVARRRRLARPHLHPVWPRMVSRISCGASASAPPTCDRWSQASSTNARSGSSGTEPSPEPEPRATSQTRSHVSHRHYRGICRHWTRDSPPPRTRRRVGRRSARDVATASTRSPTRSTGAGGRALPIAADVTQRRRTCRCSSRGRSSASAGST